MKKVKVAYYVRREIIKEVEITDEQWEKLSSKDWDETFSEIEMATLENEEGYEEETFSIKKENSTENWCEY